MEQKGIVEARKRDLKSDKTAASESLWDRVMRACRFTESGNRGEGATHLGQPERADIPPKNGTPTKFQDGA